MATHITELVKQTHSSSRTHARVALVALLTLVTGCTNGAGAGPVAGDDAAVVVAFDGDTCSWEGPLVIEQGTVEMELANSADIDVLISAFSVGEAVLAQELERIPVGTDREVIQLEAFPNGDRAFTWPMTPGESATRSHLLPVGTYLVDCLTGTLEHIWRAAQVEVVAP